MAANTSRLERTDEDVGLAAEAEGRADLDAGRVATSEAVKRWLRSWGAPDELPPPRSGD